jgi:general secretion pathway protein I
MAIARNLLGDRSKHRLTGVCFEERRRGFTLLEVMVALAVIGIALLPLLTLQRQNLRSIVRSRDVTCAALLAQEMMARAELEKFPPLGSRSGDFQSFHPGRYPNFRWQRTVESSLLFPDLRKVTVVVSYGPHLSHSFTLVEFLHNPLPLPPNG